MAVGQQCCNSEPKGGRRMKTRKIHLKRLLIFIALPVFLIMAGVTIAFMFKTSGEKHNAFLPAKVTCAVSETFDGTQKTSVAIRNTGNTAAYLRLRLVSYWVDADDNIVGKESEMPQIPYNSANWLKGADDVYYYTLPVAAGETTAYNLLTAPIVLEESTYHDMPVYQVVEVFADGIQSEPADAVKEAWGMDVQNGKLIP